MTLVKSVQGHRVKKRLMKSLVDGDIRNAFLDKRVMKGQTHPKEMLLNEHGVRIPVVVDSLLRIEMD